MGNAPRWILGISSAGFAAMLIYSERLASSNAPVVTYLVAAFCGSITIACFSASLRNSALRFIGAMVFLATAAYLVDELVTEPTKAYAGRSEPHWLNAIFALLVFGLPGLRLALWKRPRRRKAAKERPDESDADVPTPVPLKTVAARKHT